MTDEGRALRLLRTPSFSLTFKLNQYIVTAFEIAVFAKFERATKQGIVKGGNALFSPFNINRLYSPRH